MKKSTELGLLMINGFYLVRIDMKSGDAADWKFAVSESKGLAEFYNETLAEVIRKFHPTLRVVSVPVDYETDFPPHHYNYRGPLFPCLEVTYDCKKCCSQRVSPKFFPVTVDGCLVCPSCVEQSSLFEQLTSAMVVTVDGKDANLVNVYEFDEGVDDVPDSLCLDTDLVKFTFDEIGNALYSGEIWYVVSDGREYQISCS